MLGAEAGPRAEELAGLLSDAGYRVTAVGDGFELMNAWTFAWLESCAQPFELIVTDGAVPLLSGPEAIQELQQFSDCRAAVVVVGPGESDLDDVVFRAHSALWPGPARQGRACA